MGKLPLSIERISCDEQFPQMNSDRGSFDDQGAHQVGKLIAVKLRPGGRTNEDE